jgi:hypothetical protein
MHKISLSVCQRIVVFGLFSVLCACGMGEGVNGGGPGGGGSGDATEGGSWLGGDWKGTYKNKEIEEGSALRETTAVATFKETAARAGEFEIKLPLLENVAVKGTYHDFQSKSLLLEITESNLSTIGAPKSTTELAYDLVGDGLELHNDRITIRLVRGETDASGNQNGKDPNQDMIVDDWLCRDANGFSWKFDIGESRFAVDVFDPSGGRKSIWMKGDVKITRGQTDADAVLTVTSAEDTSYVGLELRGNTIGPSGMNLRRMVVGADGQKAVKETMGCNTI